MILSTYTSKDYLSRARRFDSAFSLLSLSASHFHRSGFHREPLRLPEFATVRLKPTSSHSADGTLPLGMITQLRYGQRRPIVNSQSICGLIVDLFLIKHQLRKFYSNCIRTLFTDEARVRGPDGRAWKNGIFLNYQKIAS